MIYRSTRSEALASPAEAILAGIAPDGGLYLPKEFSFPTFSAKDTVKKDFYGIASDVLFALFPEFTREEVENMVKNAYEGKFETEDVTPTVKVGDDYILELFRGPTCAFKDVALSILPHLLVESRRKKGVKDDIVILTATSGDTGKAALQGFQDVEGTKILVFFPHGGVSRVQRAQMVTQRGENTYVAAIEGNFDDAQTGVKNIFANFAKNNTMDGTGARLSSANSINIGRLAPQIVYYFKSYGDLLRDGVIAWGDKVDFVVPTGNFGDILAGYFAKILGLPVGKLVCASNKNNILTDFIRTGIYDKRRPFYQTTSPSMDILVSSNLERLIYTCAGEDSDVNAKLMQQLKEDGKYEITSDMKEKLADFIGGYATEAETAATIRKVYEKAGYVIDTHTAVAATVFYKYKEETKDDTVTVIASTASPYKFTRSVMEAVENKETNEDDFTLVDRLCEVSGVKDPNAIEEIRNAKVRHTMVCDKDKMQETVTGILGLK